MLPLLALMASLGESTADLNHVQVPQNDFVHQHRAERPHTTGALRSRSDVLRSFQQRGFLNHIATTEAPNCTSIIGDITKAGVCPVIRVPSGGQQRLVVLEEKKLVGACVIVSRGVRPGGMGP